MFTYEHLRSVLERATIPKSSSETFSGRFTNYLKMSREVDAEVRAFLIMFHRSNPVDKNVVEKLKEHMMKMNPMVKLASFKCLLSVFKHGFGDIGRFQMRFKVLMALKLMAELSVLPSEVLESISFMTNGDGAELLLCTSRHAAETMLPDLAQVLNTLVEKLEAFELSDARIGLLRMKSMVYVLQFANAYKVGGDSLEKAKGSMKVLCEGRHGMLMPETTTLTDLLALVRKRRREYGQTVSKESRFFMGVRHVEETFFNSVWKHDDVAKYHLETKLEMKGTVIDGIAYIESLARNLSALTVTALVLTPIPMEITSSTCLQEAYESQLANIPKSETHTMEAQLLAVNKTESVLLKVALLSKAHQNLAVTVSIRGESQGVVDFARGIVGKLKNV